MHSLRRPGSDDLAFVQGLRSEDALLTGVGDGSNPNAVGEEGVSRVLRSLIEDAFLVGEDKSLVPLSTLASTSCALAVIIFPRVFNVNY